MSSGRDARQPDIDLPVDILPFGARAEPHQHMVKGRFLIGREFEPGQEVEGFAMIARMVELAVSMMKSPSGARQSIMSPTAIASCK